VIAVAERSVVVGMVVEGGGAPVVALGAALVAVMLSLGVSVWWARRQDRARAGHPPASPLRAVVRGALVGLGGAAVGAWQVALQWSAQ
jgi:hypothetical protein